MLSAASFTVLRMTDPRPPVPPRVLDDLPSATEAIASDLTIGGVAYAGAVVAGEFELTELGECRVVSSRWSGSRWRRCVIGDSVIDESDLGNVTMADCGWQRVVVSRSRLTGADLSGCTIQNARFTGCVVNLSNWRFATLRKVAFEDCKLTGGDFAGASLSDVRFSGCDLSEAQFREVRIDRVRLERCRLDAVGGLPSLAGATIDPLDLIGLGYQLAAALGIRIDDGTDT